MTDVRIVTVGIPALMVLAQEVIVLLIKVAHRVIVLIHVLMPVTLVFLVAKVECRLVITALFPVVRLPVTLVFRDRVVEVVNSIVIVHIVQAGKALVHLATALITLVLNVSALLIVFVIIVILVVI